MRMRRILGLLLAFAIHPAAGQQVKVNGGFLQDSVAIGQPLPYYLTATYPANVTVLFPDSTFRFESFEFVSKRYFVTQTSRGFSYDSVIYLLRTFGIEPLQSLSLPVFIASGNDSLQVSAAPDTVKLISTVKSPPPDTIPVQNLPLKTNTAYKAVQFIFNYPVFIIGSGALLIISLLVWIIYGKRIRKYFIIRRMKADYAAFSKDFDRHTSQLSTKFTVRATEESLSLWKKYLEKLEQKPFTKLTTRETISMEIDEQLAHLLPVIDRAIYGNQSEAAEPVRQLQQIAEKRFQKKLEEVKNG